MEYIPRKRFDEVSMEATTRCLDIEARTICRVRYGMVMIMDGQLVGQVPMSLIGCWIGGRS